MQIFEAAAIYPKSVIASGSVYAYWAFSVLARSRVQLPEVTSSLSMVNDPWVDSQPASLYSRLYWRDEPTVKVS